MKRRAFVLAQVVILSTLALGLAVFSQTGKGLFDVIPGVDRIQAGEGVQVVLGKRDPVVFKPGVVFVGLVPAEDAKFDRHGDYSELAARRARTAAASCWSIFTVSSQPIQASVTDTP